MTLRCWPPLCFPKARVGIVSLRLTSSSAILEPGGGKGPLWGLCLDFRALFLVSRVFAKFVSYTIWDLLLFATFPLQVFEFFFSTPNLSMWNRVDVVLCTLLASVSCPRFGIMLTPPYVQRYDLPFQFLSWKMEIVLF